MSLQQYRKSLLIFSIVIINLNIVPGLVHGQQVQEIWGTTTAGGSGNLGVIFKMNADGTALAVQKQFSYSTTIKNSGPSSVGMLQASNGKLYGFVGGGAANQGSLFEFDLATSAYVVGHDFGITATDGTGAPGRPVQTSNGKIYGLTASGGANKQGTIWEYDPATKTYTKRFDFNSASGTAAPQGSFLLGPNGKLYAMTSNDGSSNSGTIIEFDPATGAVVVKHNFIDATTGSLPFGDLILASNGKMYGMAWTGGAGSAGTLFEFDYNTGTTSAKYSFGVGGDTSTGEQPCSSLTDGGNGKLYGMTNQGGSNNQGVLFEFNPATGVLSKKVDFGGAPNGSQPYGSMTLATNGKLYGLTKYGGANKKGILFEFDPNTGVYTKKLDLDGSTNGASPYDGGLLKASNGKLYGLMAEGGANNTGGILEYDAATGQNSLILSFGKSNDGVFPPGEFAIGPNKKLYGLAESGGTSNHGVIYEIDPATSVFTVRANFSLEVTGYQPIGRMVVVNGKMYGTTFYGGVNSSGPPNAIIGDGVIYEFDPTTFVLTKKFDFDANTSGASSYGGLTPAPNGKLYGMTSFGGAYFGGTLFEFDPASGIFAKKVDFNPGSSGVNPRSGSNAESTLVLAPNNKLYGTVRSGGVNSNGVIFEFDPATSVFTRKVDMNSAGGGPSQPRGSLTLAPNGKLYGLTNLGGSNGVGTLYEYDPGATTITKKYDFTGAATAGSNDIRGSLMVSTNGKLYGTTNLGGANNKGIIFEYDPTSNTFTKKLDFDGTNGASPWRGSLTLGPLVTPVVTGDLESFDPARIVVSPNPVSSGFSIFMQGITGEKQIIVYDLTGHELHRRVTSENEVAIDASGFAPGVYVVRTVANQHSSVDKIIKK